MLLANGGLSSDIAAFHPRLRFADCEVSSSGTRTGRTERWLSKCTHHFQRTDEFTFLGWRSRECVAESDRFRHVLRRHVRNIEGVILLRKPRLLLADDHPIVLAALKRLLSEEYDVVATATDGKSLVAAAAKLTPDIVILDFSTRGMNCIKPVRRLRSILPSAGLLILSVYTDSVYVREALKAGARGYVLKQSEPSDLFTAIRAVLAGRTYITPSISMRANYRNREPRLTLRQVEVLRLTAEGLHNKEIAHKMAISPKTVEFHKASIMERLNLHNSAMLTRYALSHGIVADALQVDRWPGIHQRRALATHGS